MLHEQNGGLVFEQQVLYLHAGKDINVVERFIPDIQMRLFAQAFGKQNLLFLPLAEFVQSLFKLLPRKIKFPQDGFEKSFVKKIAPDIFIQRPVQSCCTLRDIGNFQPLAFS